MLVRDDFGGYLSYDDDLAGVQQCLAHVIRYLDDAHAIDPDAQAWARQVADALRGAIHEINTTRACGCPKVVGRSCDLLILVEEPAEAVVSFDLVDLGCCATGEWS